MKKYPFEKQEESKDCGPACLSMIIRYHNGYFPIDNLRDMAKESRDGTTAYHLMRTLQEVGFESYGVECKFENFYMENLFLPCIANIIVDNYKHFIVIYKINYKKNYLIIGDPQDRVKRVSFNEFRNVYNNVLLIAKPYKTIPIVNSHNYKFMYDIILNNKGIIFKLIILSIILTIVAILSSLYFEYIVRGINIQSNAFIYNILIIFFSINVLKSLISLIRNKVLINLNQRVDYSLTSRVFQKIIMLPYYYYRNRSTGDIISRISDLSIIRDMISKVFITLFIDIPLTCISLILLYLLNHALFIITIISIVIYLITILFFKNIYNGFIKQIQTKKADVSSLMVESISGFETLKGLHIENLIINKFKKNYFNLTQRIRKYQSYYFIHNFFKDIINDLSFIIVIFVGSILVINNKYTLGSLLTFNALFNLFIEPFKSIMELDNEIKEAKSAIKRVNEIIVKQDNNSGLIDKKLIGNIDFNNVSYTFNDRDFVLKNINISIKKNSKVIVVGKSGSGKSTLFKFLMKYYKVVSGQVIIDGIDINNIDKNTIERDIVYINQNEMLFNDTIYNNINITDSNNDSFMSVTKMCYIDSIYNDLGYNMMIEENGFNISGGERQRIILARSLLRSFKILIIDEGLNQVDIDLERKILKKMFKTYSDKTIIFISHRLDNVDLFDQLIEINNGTLIRNEIKRN